MCCASDFFQITASPKRCRAEYRLPPQKWLARRPEALRLGGSVWSAVASGIPRDTAFPGFATHADPSQWRREPK